jgi:hypothetical protein
MKIELKTMAHHCGGCAPRNKDCVVPSGFPCGWCAASEEVDDTGGIFVDPKTGGISFGQGPISEEHAQRRVDNVIDRFSWCCNSCATPFGTNNLRACCPSGCGVVVCANGSEKCRLLLAPEAHLCPGKRVHVSDRRPAVHNLQSLPRCAFCNATGSRTVSLQQCHKCKKVRHCGKECQKGDWKLHHKAACSAPI